MTPQRLRNKLRKIREQGVEMQEEGGELNLVPYLDIVTNVIMFMLATTTFAAALGDVNVSAPTTTSAVSATPPDQPPKQDLNLTVSISDKGFMIAASGAVLHQGFKFGPTGDFTNTDVPGSTVPKNAKGEFDYEALAAAMRAIKASPTAANETKLLLNANAEIPYEVVIATLDACRGKLILKPDPANPGKTVETYENFGDVVLVAGVN